MEKRKPEKNRAEYSGRLPYGSICHEQIRRAEAVKSKGSGSCLGTGGILLVSLALSCLDFFS